jgi:MHS family metabolite:H+ symporter-like MFS transporter
MSNDDGSSLAGSADKEYADNLRRATFASSVGSALEYYDFALYGLASALIFGKLFFPGLGANAALIAAFGTYAVGFLARPIGGVVFGTLGDRIGRKWVLMATVGLMGGASTAIGLMPTHQQLGAKWGWLAPVFLILLRLCQGFGAGAEQAGATVLMAEYSPRRRRGFFASLPFIGIQGGTLIAAAVFALITLAPNDVLLGWLWRVPFLVSVFLVATAIYIRSRLAESPAFVKLEKKKQAVVQPLAVFATSRKNIALGIGLRMAENGGSYIFSTLAVSFVALIGVKTTFGPIAVALASLIGIFTVPLAGHLSDRIGRVKVYRMGAGFLLVMAFPGWYLLSLGNPAIAIVVIALSIGFGVNGMLGPQCSLLPELFGAQHRYLGVAMSREFSALIAGGIAPMIGAWLLSVTNNSWVPIAIYVFVLASITFTTTFFTPETLHRNLDKLADAYVGEDNSMDDEPTLTMVAA